MLFSLAYCVTIEYICSPYTFLTACTTRCSLANSPAIWLLLAICLLLRVPTYYCTPLLSVSYAGSSILILATGILVSLCHNQCLYHAILYLFSEYCRKTHSTFLYTAPAWAALDG
jgi:hypothetical protein